MIGVKINAKSAIKRLNHIIDGLDDAIADGLESAANAGAKVAQRRSKGSVRAGIEVQRGGKDVKLVSKAPWSSVVEHGRGEVRAKGNGLLRFEVGGRVIFTKRVGPARPRPFMAPAGVVMSRSVAVDKSIERLLRGL